MINLVGNKDKQTEEWILYSKMNPTAELLYLLFPDSQTSRLKKQKINATIGEVPQWGTKLMSYPTEEV